MATILHIGTYEESGGKGLVPLTVGDDGSLAPGEPYAGAANASFGVRGNALAYLVDEQNEGAINVLRPVGDGWESLARVPTAGSAPCYLALDQNAARLAVANYASGSVALYRLDAEGLPQAQPAMFQAEGSGPNEERQEGPHAHCVRFLDGALYVVDLGSDEVRCLTLGPGGVFVDERRAWRAPPGTGPRHLLFHPDQPRAVVLSELAATLTLLETDACELRAIQSTSTEPPHFEGENLGGHLAFNAAGDRVYVSNRGHNSLAVFALEDDRLQLLQHVASGGAHPRQFVVLEALGLLVAVHEKDGRITSFRVAENGTLTATGHAVTVSGACFALA